jgi:5-methyltetrahydrofolate--homocysteine methyltransferase
VPVTTSLLSDDGKAAFVAATPRGLRGAAPDARRPAKWTLASLDRGPRRPRVADHRRRRRAPRSLGRHRARRPRSPSCARTSTGRRSFTPGSSRASTRASSPTRSTASRRGSSSPTATSCSTAHRKLRAAAQGVYGLFAANAVGDDVELYTDESRAEVLATFHFLRQQSTARSPESRTPLPRRLRRAEGHRPERSPRRLRREQRARGSTRAVARFKAEHDDYNAIMAEALADRLAEAFAECCTNVRARWGFGATRTSRRRPARGEVPRDPPAAGLPGVPRPHREGPRSGRCSTSSARRA